LHNSNWKGLFAIEKSPDAFETLKQNLIENINHFEWPEWLPQTNLDIDFVIRKYKNELISLQGKVDLIAGGPPCQGFSTAGNRYESDSRNSLIESYLIFIDQVKPKLIFFENVKGFTMEFSRNKTLGKKYSEYVKSELQALGYEVEGKIIDFSKFGIPQKRNRFILIGIRKDIVNKKVKEFFRFIRLNRKTFLASKDLSLKTNLGQAISDLLREHGTIDSPDTAGFLSGLYSKPKTKYQRFLRKGITKMIPDSHRFVNHSVETVKLFSDLLDSATKNRRLCAEEKEKFKVKKRALTVLGVNKPCRVLTSHPDDYLHYSEPRILSVREYARIQSFPDWYEFKGKYTTGGKRRKFEVPRYTQLGNAIPPLFAEQVGLALITLLNYE